MAEKTLNTRIQHKHDIEANWKKATSFVPKEGEIIIYDKDANYSYQRIKIGDGTRTVTALPFVTTTVNGKIGDVRITASSIGAADANEVNNLSDMVDLLSTLTIGQLFETKDYNDLSNRPCYEDLTISSYNISKAPYVGLADFDGSMLPLRQLPDIPIETLVQVTSGIISTGNAIVGIEEMPINLSAEIAGDESLGLIMVTYPIQQLEIPCYIIKIYEDGISDPFGISKKGTYFVDMPMLVALDMGVDLSLILNFPNEITIPGKQLDDALIPDNIARLDDIPVIEDIEVPVQSVNGKTGEVVLNAADVGALPSTTVIPDALADLTADSTHRTVTDAEKATWNAKSNFSGNYNDLTNKPTIPSIAGLATETYVDNAVAGIVESAPETLDTLNELAAALGDDPNFATTMATELGKKVPNTRTINGKALSSNITLSAADIGVGYAICNTEAGNNKLVATLSGYTLTNGGIVAVKFANDVPYAPYLNINNQGEKAVYHNRNWLRAGMIHSGNIATFIYAEGQYNLLSVDNNIGIRITSNDAIITRNAADEDDNYKFGYSAFAHGDLTKASGYASHAEGYATTASGTESHAEGSKTTASGSHSHAEGRSTKASGTDSHAEGNNTTASGAAQHVIGVRNIPDANNQYAYIVGNAKFDIDENNQITDISSAPSNAHTLDWDGNAWFSGDVYVGSTSGTNKDEGSLKLATEEYVKEYVNITAITNAEIDAICGAVIYSGEEVEL